jgi:hypothetical protein
MKRSLQRGPVMLSLSKHLVFVVVTALVAFPTTIHAETETIDLKALAKKARPAVMLLVVSDADGKEIATGTGFLVSSDGKLITNHHVIEGGASAVAKAENGGLFPVEGVLADDPKNDLILLKLEGKDLPFLTLSTNSIVDVGSRIAVIGSPLGLEGTLSEGIVSAVREQFLSDIRLLQITAPISSGSSGSPVLNAKGEVIGVVSSLMRGGQALNFAVSSQGITMLLLASFHDKSFPLRRLAVTSDSDWFAAFQARSGGDYVQELKHAEALVRRYPDDAEAWVTLGIAYTEAGSTQQAISAYQQGFKLEPDSPYAGGFLLIACQKAKRWDDAIAVCRQLIKLKPDDANAWSDLGLTYSMAGLTNEAAAAYQRVRELKPELFK